MATKPTIKPASKPKRDLPMILAAVLGTIAFAVGTYAVVEAAGGTDVEADYSNTPNGVVPGPPEAR